MRAVERKKGKIRENYDSDEKPEPSTRGKLRVPKKKGKQRL